MERAEKIGLGVAAAGHIVLFGLLSLNLIFNDDSPKLGDPSVAVDIVGDPGSSEILSDIPLPISDPEPDVLEASPDPDTPDEMTPAPPDTAAPPPLPQIAETPPIDRSADQKRQREIEQRRQQEIDDRKRRDQEAKAQRDAETRKQREADAKRKKDTAERRRRIAAAAREAANNANAASSGPPAKAAGQVRGEIRALIGSQVKPFLRGCTPNGVDVRRIVTRVTLKLNRNGSLAGLSGVSQSGINDNNRPQAKPMENCVVGAIRRAAPFSGLDDAYYNVWKNHKMAFKGT